MKKMKDFDIVLNMLTQANIDFRVEEIEVNATELGGVKEAIYSVTGTGAYKLLKYDIDSFKKDFIYEDEICYLSELLLYLPYLLRCKSTKKNPHAQAHAHNYYKNMCF